MENERNSKMGTSIYITALDSIVNVNSLYTFAVFVGLAWNPIDSRNSLIDNPSCVPSFKVAEDVISYHVFSFSSFLFSSLIAMCLKQAIRIAKTADTHFAMIAARVNKTILRFGILVSAVGSAAGCVFLMLAIVNLVQFKLGTLSCPSKFSIAATVPLVIFVPLALVVYVCLVFYAFTR